jgi:hypothetical protein
MTKSSNMAWPETPVIGTFQEQFQTPANVARHLISMIPAAAKTVLEPTPGMGNIVREFPPHLEVTAPYDYFTMEKKRFDCIVMNPPFSRKWAFNVPHSLDKKGMQLGYHILHECMEMSDSVIALMPWFTLLDSDVRMRHMINFGLVSVTALPRRTFNYARIQTCILELRKGHDQPTVFKKFNWNTHE